MGFSDDGGILLKKAGEDKPFVADPKSFGDKDSKFIAELSKLRGDKGFIAGLKAKPDNIHLDSTNVKAANQLQWEAQVIRDIGKLGELEEGRGVLDAVKGLGKEITIKGHSTGDNRAVSGDVYYDPGRTIGARSQSGDKERPPFIGLGQEISNAERNVSHPTLNPAQREQRGLRVGQQLRTEYNEAIRDPVRRKELNDRYPDSPGGYPGWGTKEVDERVLDLNGRPLSRRRDQ